MEYRVDKGIVYSEYGIPEAPRWFADGRLDFQFDETGITQVDYRSPAQKQGNPVVFLRGLWDGFRYYLERDGLTYKPEYSNTSLWPYGAEAEWKFEGAVFKHRVMAVEESIVIQIDTPEDCPGGMQFKLEFYDYFALIPTNPSDLRYSDAGAERKWRDWCFNEAANLVEGGYDEIPRQQIRTDPEGLYLNNPEVGQGNAFERIQLHIGIGADFPVIYSKRQLTVKQILKSQPMKPGRQYSFMIVFDPQKESLNARYRNMTQSIDKMADAQNKRYRAVAESMPQLVSPYKRLNDFISLVPMYHESFKIKDRPGAVKAKTDYWVWGWDGMTCGHSYAYWGDNQLVEDILKFYEDTADPELGIGHCFRQDMSLWSVSALPAQGMYIALLQIYYANTGNLYEIKKRYPFAKSVFQRIAASEAGETGFCKGTSLFPDFPGFMQETGNDVSGLNNTIFYCSARSMEYLASLVKDEEIRRKAAAFCHNMELNFIKLFFDKEKGFIVSSIDGETFKKRDSFNSNAIKWENSYCRDLLGSKARENLEFFEKNIICKAGLREIPVWSKAFDMDANQLHCWWPVTGEYYMRLINALDRKDLIDRWVGWVGYWTEKLMCPEGISCYIETDEPDLDRWSSLPGSWYAYSMRAWYEAAIHGVVGVECGAGGLTFYPYSGEEMTLKGLHHAGRVFDIEMKGSGGFIEKIEIGGKVIKGTNKLPADLYGDKERIGISVYRVRENPYSVSIVHGYGLEISNYAYNEGSMTAGISGAGTGRLALCSCGRPEIKVDGQPAAIDYNGSSKQAVVHLEMMHGKERHIEIHPAGNPDIL